MQEKIRTGMLSGNYIIQASMGKKKAAIHIRVAAGVQTTNRGVVWKCVKSSNASLSLEVIIFDKSIAF